MITNRTKKVKSKQEGKHISLVTLSISDLKSIHHNFTNNVTKHLFRQKPVTIDITKEAIEGHLETMNNAAGMYFVIRLKKSRVDSDGKHNSGEFIGCSSLVISKDRSIVKPKLWIKETMWNKGYGSEVFSTLTQISSLYFDKLPLFITIANGNNYAKKIIDRFGGVRLAGQNPCSNEIGEPNILFFYKIQF